MENFTAKLELIGINPFVFVPETILKIIFEQAGKSKGYVPIRGTVNGNSYIQTLVKYKGEWRLYINIWATDEYWYSIIAETPDFVNRREITEFNSKEIFDGIVHRANEINKLIGSYSDE